MKSIMSVSSDEETLMNSFVLIGDERFVSECKVCFGNDLNIIAEITDLEDCVKRFLSLVEKNNNDVLKAVVCEKNYLDIGKQLFDAGLSNYYVFMDGFLFLCDLEELMQPIELFSNACYTKENDKEKNILIVKNNMGGDTTCLVNELKEDGYVVLLLNLGPISKETFSQYDNCVRFSTMRGIRKYVQTSEIDLIYCLSGTGEVANLLLNLRKPIVYEVSENSINNNELILEYMAYMYCSGIVYTDEKAWSLYKNQFAIIDRPEIVYRKKDNSYYDSNNIGIKVVDFCECVKRNK